jgi:hypothetical protein
MAEVFGIFLLIVLLVLLIILFSVSISKINGLGSKLQEMVRKINSLSAQIARLEQNQQKPHESYLPEQPAKLVDLISEKEKLIAKTATETKATAENLQTPSALQEKMERIASTEEMKVVHEPKIMQQSPVNQYQTKKVEKQLEPERLGFFERHPDFEKFIGQNLINKIGIAILVIGIGFLIKFAVDKNYINDVGRALIGVVSSAILIGFAHRLSKSFAAFSSVLIGGANAILYFTIYISFFDYHLFSQTVAFALMVMVAAFTVVLSVAYNRQELAILSTIGGFLTPLLVSTGQGNYAILFSYIAILNFGMLALAVFKKWKIVNITTYLATIILFSVWFGAAFAKKSSFPFVGTLFFGTLFYLQFFVMNIINNLKFRQKFQIWEFSILLSNTFYYYIYALVVIDDFLPLWKGALTAALALFNFFFAYFFYKREQVDRNVIYLLIGLVLTFVSLFAPVQMKGNYITLFWSAEAVLLLWMNQKTNLKMFRVTSVLVQMVMLVSLLLDWVALSAGKVDGSLVLNKTFITGVFSFASLIAYYRILKNDKDDIFILSIPVKIYQKIIVTISAIVLYLVGFFEIFYFLPVLIHKVCVVQSILGIYNYLFVFLLLLSALKYKNEMFIKISVFLNYTVILLFLLVYNFSIIGFRSLPLQNPGDSFLAFGLHYFVTLLILSSISLIYFVFNKVLELSENQIRAAKFSLVFLLVYIFSCELDHILVYSNALNLQDVSEFLEKSHRIGWPVLWGVLSLLLMLVGMKRYDKTFRILALALFLATLLKLFIFDIWKMSQGGITIAFISLGILLLIVSFLYQKVKQIFIDDNKRSTNENESL